jgi:hypothetical protein
VATRADGYQAIFLPGESLYLGASTCSPTKIGATPTLSPGVFRQRLALKIREINDLKRDLQPIAGTYTLRKQHSIWKKFSEKRVLHSST